jgi:membrane-associated phospholipid phosphatase
LITEGLKAVTREKRPDTNEHDSFPSGHATAAFAVATMASAYHPEQKSLWYLGATLISASRVRLNRHHPQDVVAGAVVGYTTARWELSEPRGLILSPIIRPDGGRGIEMQWGHAF